MNATNLKSATKSQINYIMGLVEQKKYKEPINYKALTIHSAGVLIHTLKTFKGAN